MLTFVIVALGFGVMMAARSVGTEANALEITRATFLRGAAAAVAASATGLSNVGFSSDAKAASTMLTRTIPSSGKPLPVIGLGTWQTFDVGTSAAERAPLSEVLKALFEAGGSVIDSSPMYGRSESVVGDLLDGAQSHGKAFLATKVWTRGKSNGIDQMERSFAAMRTKHMDLMQVHNLVDWQTHLDTLKGWKAEGRVSYLGVTHYTSSAFDELEAVMRREKLDFVQLNYAIDDRAAEKKLLPLALERGIAVLVNKPFGGGGALGRLKDKPLPAFAGEIGCTSWAQVLLKFIVSHPAITCAIPGTRKATHMKDNSLAGMGALPDAAMREKIAAAAG
jgi:diketogulonate reductase-like aldo/keto reductase